LADNTLSARESARARAEGEAMNGYSKLGMTNTEMGDRVEAALAAIGWKPLNGQYRQGAFDLEAPDGAWVEVKACSESAAEWKVKMKAREMAGKAAAAATAGKLPAIVIAVVRDDLTCDVYRRDGLGCFRLPKGGSPMWSLVAQLERI